MSSKEEAELVAAVRTAMMPQLEAALTGLLKSWSDAMRAASEAEIDRCIKVVEMCRTEKRGPAWNEGLAFAVESLQMWKKDSATQTGSVDR